MIGWVRRKWRIAALLEYKITIVGLEAKHENRTKHMTVYGRRLEAEEKKCLPLWQISDITRCQRANITDKFTASPYVVMATTHVGSPACPWLPECTLETTTMRWRRMRKNPLWIHHRCSCVGKKCSLREKYIREAEHDHHHHRFAFVCAVWRHIRYEATVKSKPTPRTLELHGDGCKFCINKKRKFKSNQVYKPKYFSSTFSLLLFLAFLVRPQSSSPSIPRSLPPSSHLASPSGGNRLNEGNPTTSLSFKKTSIEGNSMI